MSLIEDLNQSQQDLPSHTKTTPDHPTGWEPGITYGDGHGTITARLAINEAPDWTALLTEWGFDPERFQVKSDTVNIRTWDAAIGNGEVRRMWYHRADITSRAPLLEPDYDRLLAEVKARRPVNLPTSTGDPLVVCLADWQMGKRDGGGTEGIIERGLRLIDSVLTEIKARKPSALYVACMGDLIESCDGHYDQQVFQVELDRRSQVKVARRLLVKMLEAWAVKVPQVVVLTVPGNHGENRKDGKSFTTFGDNDDIALVEQAAEILAANPERFGHVKFLIPEEEMTWTLDIGGTIVGFAHGHQATRGGTLAQAKLKHWWRGQMEGRKPIGDADVLISAHYHHFAVVSDGSRTWMQCPTLDGGSEWFEHLSGAGTTPGTLVVSMGGGKWDGLRIL